MRVTADAGDASEDEVERLAWKASPRKEWDQKGAETAVNVEG